VSLDAASAGTANPRGRPRWPVLVLLVLGSILLILANAGYWVQHTLIDSNEFSNNVDGVLEDPDTATRVGDVLARRILESGELQREIAQALPAEASFLPILLEDDLEGILSRAIARTIESSTVQAALDRAIRELHTMVVSILEGKDSNLVIEDNQLVLDLNPVVSSVFDRLNIEEPQRLRDGDLGRVVLVRDARYLDIASTIVRGIETAVPVLIVLTIAALGASVVISQDRERGVVYVGYMVLLAGVISLVVWKIANIAFDEFLGSTLGARDLLESLTANLRAQSIFLIVLGAAVGLIADARVRAFVSRQTHDLGTGIERIGATRAIIIGATGATVLLLVS
jgi:hypothetical protein